MRTLSPWHSTAIFIGIPGTSLSSFVLSIEMLNLLLHVTQALFVTRRRHQLVCRPHLLDLAAKSFALNEVVDYRMALQAICSAIVTPSLPRATSSSEVSEVSHSLLVTRATLLDIHLRRVICADLDNPTRCHVWCASHRSAQRGHPS